METPASCSALRANRGTPAEMCVGIPMCVIEVREGFALCDGMGETRLVDMKLVGDQPRGTHVLVFLDVAREVMSAEQAAAVGNALKALHLAMTGAGTPDDIDSLFADLANRTPELPDHLKPVKSC